MSFIDTEHKALEFLVADHPGATQVAGGRPLICGFTWLIESSRTSFYIKSLVPAWGFAKISLHGPDPGEDEPHNRFDFESNDEMITKAVRAGGSWSPHFSVAGPEYFDGKPVSRRARHVVRFSTSGELFTRGAPSGPPPVIKEKATQKKRFDPPGPLRVLYVDIFVSSVRPYWPDGEEAARNQSWFLGPMMNRAGQYLTGMAHSRLRSGEPDPFSEERGGRPAHECYRDIGYSVADDGVLWVCETLVSPDRRSKAIIWPPNRRLK